MSVRDLLESAGQNWKMVVAVACLVVAAGVAAINLSGGPGKPDPTAQAKQTMICVNPQCGYQCAFEELWKSPTASGRLQSPGGRWVNAWGCPKCEQLSMVHAVTCPKCGHVWPDPVYYTGQPSGTKCPQCGADMD